MNRLDTFMEKHALVFFIAIFVLMFGAVLSAMMLWRSEKLVACASHNIGPDVCSQLLSSISA